MKNRMKTILSIALTVAIMPSLSAANRSETTLTEGWRFTKGTADAGTQWQMVTVPHDWAIYGPFDRSNDLQVVAVEQNGETEKTVPEACHMWVRASIAPHSAWQRWKARVLRWCSMAL